MRPARTSRRSAVALARRVVVQPLDLAGDMGTLALQVLRHRALQPRVADPVHAPRLRRVETAQVLELATRPGLEALQTADDAQFDAGVVADIEVEVSQPLEGAPVPAVEHTGLVHVERAGDHLA